MSFVSPSEASDRPGYGSIAYAATLMHIGTPVDLPAAGTQLITRDVPGSSYRDACAPYPLLCCSDWGQLAEELAELSDLVSLMAVIDPLGGATQAELESSFPDLLRPFKRHYIVNLDEDFDAARSSQHRRKVRRALRDARVERVADPVAHADDWLALYGDLRERHGFSQAPSDFTEQGLREQLALPGMVYYRALMEDECVGAYLFLQQGADAYYHLGASNDQGRSVGVSFALMDSALREASDAGLSRVDLGSSASLQDDETDGLARFKKGWSTSTAIAHIGGRIMNQDAYKELSAAVPNTEFFPAYRAPRFGAGASA